MFLPGSLQGSCWSRQRLTLWGVPGNISHCSTCPLLSPPPGRVRNLRPWGMQALSPLSVVSQGKQSPPLPQVEATSLLWIPGWLFHLFPGQAAGKGHQGRAPLMAPGQPPLLQGKWWQQHRLLWLEPLHCLPFPSICATCLCHPLWDLGTFPFPAVVLGALQPAILLCADSSPPLPWPQSGWPKISQAGSFLDPAL